MARSQSKREFRHKGNDNQKSADFIIDLQLVSRAEMSSWTDEQKEKALEWLQESKRVFDAFALEIKLGCTNK